MLGTPPRSQAHVALSLARLLNARHATPLAAKHTSLSRRLVSSMLGTPLARSQAHVALSSPRLLNARHATSSQPSTRRSLVASSPHSMLGTPLARSQAHVSGTTSGHWRQRCALERGTQRRRRAGRRAAATRRRRHQLQCAGRRATTTRRSRQPRQVGATVLFVA